jgi:hypothetical protein
MLSPSSGVERQNDKKCGNFIELVLVTNNGNIEFAESIHII